MRGKPAEVAGAWTATRIIPAHAGQTPQSMLRPATQPDHPRACGANQQRAGEAQLACGSSPRMRGKRHPPSPCNPVMRIIPAHAGQTVSNSSRTSARSDHPRACGANPALSVMTAAPAGSSPRMRGKLGFGFDSFRQRRIIPAHAGQTSRTPTPTPTPTVSDHPRACGANAAAGRIRTLRRGSSPRMRGKQGGRRKLEREIRIIPAHAGQTRALARPDQRRTDHPRACGANSSGAFSMIRLIGSSPRMRGKRVGSVPVGILARIIPAHAGQTQSHQRNGKEDADHPRACGANNGNN